MRVVDAHGVPIGVVKRVLTRGEVLRWPHVHRDSLPPEQDFPFIIVEARSHHSLGHPYYGYYIPCHAVVEVDDQAVRLSGVQADLDNLGWDSKPGFLP